MSTTPETGALLFEIIDKPPVPLRLLEGFLRKQTEQPKSSESILEVLTSVGVSKEHLKYTATVISDWLLSINKNRKSPKTAKSVVGSASYSLLSEAGFTETCLVLADFNPFLARKIYQEEDFRLVFAAYTLKTRFILAQVHGTHEAVGLAFGGESKGGKASSAPPIDVHSLPPNMPLGG